MRKHPNRTTTTASAPSSTRADERVERETGHVLLVSDDDRSFKMIASLLGADYEISRAGTADAAMEILDDGSKGACCSNVDVVIVDAGMRGTSGFDLCRRLRRNPGTADMSVAIVTSVDSLPEKVRAIEAGADDLISRPIDQIEIRARVRSLLRVSRLRRQLEQRPTSFKDAGSEPGCGSFTRVVVHDLRSPLVGILGNAQLLEAKCGQADAALARLTHRIVASARQLQARLSDTLDIHLFETEQRPLALSRTDVRAAAAMVIEEYAEMARSCEVSLELEPADQGPDTPVAEARADAGVLLRIIANLLEVGLKHAPPGGTIRIVVRVQSAGKVEVHVADTGEVDDGEANAAGAEMEAAAPARSRPENSFDKSLALRYSHLAVQAHGGRLWMEQNAAGGQTFGFVLPSGEEPE